MEINRLLNPTTLPLNTRTPSSRMSLSNLLSPSEPNSPATSTGPLKKRAIKQSTRQPKKRARNLEEEEEKAVKSRRRWTPAENKQLSALKGEHLSWAQIAAKIPDRSHTSCRLRFQNYVDSKDDAEKERKAKVARLYMSKRREMWTPLANQLGESWEDVEALHWKLGERGIVEASRTPVLVPIQPRLPPPPPPPARPPPPPPATTSSYTPFPFVQYSQTVPLSD